MNLKLVKIKFKEKYILQNLMELYQYDFSDIDDFDIDNSGLFGYKYIDHYWTEKDRYPFFVKVAGKLAGFVLINKHIILSENIDTFSIAEFFILKKFRKKGIGKLAAFKAFDLFPGKWEVCQTSTNTVAQIFWRKVINEYTEGNFKEKTLNNRKWKGTVQYFENVHKKE